MAQTIQLKRSSVAGNIPGTSDLALGEIAINTADGAVYIKTGNDDIIAVADDGILHIDTTNSRVGIGTTSPTAKLDINGPTKLGSGSFSGSVDTQTDTSIVLPQTKKIYSLSSSGQYLRNIFYHDGGNGHFIFGQQGTSLIADMLFYPGSSGNIRFYGSGSEDVRINASGLMGIGTTSPSKKLEVVSTNSGSNFAGIQLRNNTTTADSSAELRFVISTDTTSTLNSAFIKALRNAGDDNDLIFGTVGSERMRIDNSGNVGIGTTSPTSPLTIKSNSTSSEASGLRIEANGSSNTIALLAEKSGNSGRFALKEDGTTKVALYADGTSNHISAGNLGIGTTTPHSGTRAQICADDTTPSLNSTAIDDCTLVLSNSDDDYGTVFATDGTGKGYIQQRRTATATYYDLNLQPHGGAVTFNSAYTFPTADGSANQVLQTDGSGNLSFATVSGGGGVTISNNVNNRVLTGDGSNANAEANLTFDGSTLALTGNQTVTGGITVGDSSADALRFVGVLKQGSGSGTTVIDSSRNLTNIGTISSGAITSSGRITTTNGLFQANEGFQKLRQYEISTGDAGGSFLLGRIESSSSTDGAVEGVVRFAYDYGSSTNNCAVHFNFAQRSGTARGTWWYEHDDQEGAADRVHVRLIDDGAGNMYVWVTAADYNRAYIETRWRQCSNLSNSGTLTAGTLTTGTTLFDTANEPTSEMHIGSLYGHSDLFLGDNKKVVLGSSTDFLLYHNGTDSVIDNNTGDLYITNKANDKDIIIRTDDGSGGFTTYMQFDGSDTSVRLSQHVKIPDSKAIYFGTGNDFNIYHNGSHSYMDHIGTGNLYIRNTTNDSDISFHSDDGSGGFTEYFRLDGSLTKTYFEKNVQFNDSVKLQLGAGADLKIYHDASNSFIENDTGDLVLRCDSDDIKILSEDDVIIGDNGDSTRFATFTNGGAVTLFHNGSSKLATKSDGVDITGELQADSLDVDGNADISGNLVLSGNLTVNGTTVTNSATNTTIEDALIELGSGNTGANSNDLGLILERGTTGNNIFIGWDESIDKVAFGTTTATGSSTGAISYSRADILASSLDLANHIDIADSGKIRLGNSDDMQLYHDGSNSYIKNDTGNLQFDAANDIIIDAGGGDIAFRDDSVEFGRILNTSGSMTLHNVTQDKDILFRGNDGGSTITALTLDMSAAGAANFNAGISISGTEAITASRVLQNVTANASIITSGTLSAARLNTGSSGSWWSGNVVKVGTDGVSEVGKYLDFHNTNTSTADFDTRLYSSGSNQLTINGSGRIFTDGYHPNADTLTTARTIGGVSFNGSANIDLPGVNTAGNQDTSGTASHANNLNATDDRDIAPEDLSFTDDLRIYFADKVRVEGGSSGSTWLDFLVLNSYSDSSGGDANALAFGKTSQNIYHYFADQAATNWGTPKQIAYTDSNITGTAAGLSGTPNITVGTISSGAITSTGDLTLNKSDPTLILNDTSGSDNQARLWLRESASYGAQLQYNSTSDTFFQINMVDGGTSTGALFINRNGNVGIGSAPGVLLDVHKNSTSGQLAEYRNDTGYFLHRTYADYNNDGTTVEFQTRVGVDGNYSTIGNYSENDFYIRTNNTDRLKFNNNGIDVRNSGSLKMNGTVVIDSSRNLTNIGTISSGAITSSSNVSCGFTSGSQGQQLEPGNTAVATLRSDADRWRVYAGGSGGAGEVFTVAQGGNIGIGRTSPSDKLDVNGSISLKNASATAANFLHLPRGGGVTFYGDASGQHSITSRNQSGTAADDILIGSYGAVYIDLDSNDNNSAGADFIIGRHSATNQNIFIVNGERSYVGSYPQIRAVGWYGSQGSSATGPAAEIGVSSSRAHLIGYDRDSSAYIGTTIAGSNILLDPRSSYVNITGSGAELQMDGTKHLTGSHDLGNISKFYLSNNFSGTYINASGNYLQIQTASGYTRIGANNSSYSHFYTDRGNFYFNKRLTVDEGIISSYNEDLQLRRTNSSNDRINIGDTVIQFFLDGSEDMRLTNTGNLDVEGDVTAYSTVVASDERLKDDVVTIENAVDKVSKLRGVEFVWNKGKREGKQDIGVIAQEVEKVLPEVVIEKELPLMEEGTTYKTVDYPKLTAVLIEAIKEQQEEIEQLKKHSHPAKDMCDMNGYEELVARIEKMEKNYGNN